MYDDVPRAQREQRALIRLSLSLPPLSFHFFPAVYSGLIRGYERDSEIVFRIDISKIKFVPDRCRRLLRPLKHRHYSHDKHAREILHCLDIRSR